jgi:lipopolysaccharide export LptBFGC system permease protein LptF
VGLLSNEVNGLPAAEQAAGADALEAYADSGGIAVFEAIGTASLLVALTAAGIALWRRAGAPLAVPVLLVLAAVPIAFHVPPFGQVGLALFIAALLLVVRARSVPAGTAAAMRPTAA